MSTAIDRVLKRSREKRSIAKAEINQKHFVGLGSVVLGRLRADYREDALEAFRLYNGINEVGEILIHSTRIGENEEETRCSFYLTEDADLIYISTIFGIEGPKSNRVVIGSPEDFLKINPEALEALYSDLMKEGFWDRVAFKHSHQGKPGYENVWVES